MARFLITTIQVNLVPSLWPFWGRTLFLQLGCFGLDILYCNTNGRVYDCIREIGLLLSNKTCFHSQITFTYCLPMVSTVKDYEQHSI